MNDFPIKKAARGGLSGSPNMARVSRIVDSSRAVYTVTDEGKDMVFNSRWPKHEVEVIGLDTWGHRLWLTKKQFKVYNCDPDAYAA